MIRRVVCIALLIWLSLPAIASVESDFDAANRLYEQGRYLDAAEAYQKLVSQDQVNATLWFNLGNARYQAGQIGRSIAAYCHALELSPGDPEILNNLRMARVKAGHKPDESLTTLLGRISLNIWAVGAGLAVTLWFGAGILAELQPARRARLRTTRLGIGLVAMLLILGTGVVAHDQLWTIRVVVNVPEAVIRRGPLADSQSKSTPADGTELDVIGRKDEWLNVRAIDGLEGWILKRHVEPLGRLGI